VDIHAQLLIEIFRNAAGRPPSRIVSFLRRASLQKSLDFLFDLRVDFPRAALAVSIIQARRPFLIEPIHPSAMHHRR
jgi:hypothetical protein